MRIQKRVIIYFLVFFWVFGYVYKSFIVNLEETKYLSAPSLRNWFGTDLTGADIFLRSMNALGIEIITISVVLPTIYCLGLFLGMLLSYFSNDKIREFFLNLIHYWVTLPVLLIALFLLILIGAGQINAIAVMIFILIPTQALYVYNQLETAKKNDFVIAKMSYGFSKSYIYIHHLFPNIVKGFTNYTLARIPEILMMNLALNFLGLGIQSPNSSFGRLLFDGLSFMFSAWWMWVFTVGEIIFLFLLINKFKIGDGDISNEFRR
ncbi:MAG TPA: hypothetical protein DCE80_10450 [Ignavibacteriales bacterium]|uniref:ABC transmembrane type-1 domain-containing protein n=1 Tax=Candidatus Daviesbacteria bacterium GW2011_GWF2_38_6 TaxID=1618432 RepID=A0A0G0NHY1_9BACT|nr:MAG: hypothetical protein US99_C0064G0003 [Candidatus Daviesbacteria bacterium GW2011_GWF2_38_6]HAB52571.1 hypothetical protein [Ignavibacteriales bacterium]